MRYLLWWIGALAAFTKWWRQSASHATRAWQWVSLQVWLILNPKVDEIIRVYAGRFLSLVRPYSRMEIPAPCCFSRMSFMMIDELSFRCWWITISFGDMRQFLGEGNGSGNENRRHKCSFSYSWKCYSGWTMPMSKLKCHSWYMFCQRDQLAILTSAHFPLSAYQISNTATGSHPGCQAIIAGSH